MAQPSRLMPAFMPTPQRVAWWWRAVGFALVVVGIGCFAWAVSMKPLVVLGSVAAVVLLGASLERWDRMRLRAIAQSRPGESICTYSRALPIRELDAWLVRAVFEQLQPYLPNGQSSFPIRPADRLVEDLRVDSDDLDDVLAPEIAQRTGRSLADCTKNPYYGKVVTVEDLIRFFCAQPKGGAAEQGEKQTSVERIGRSQLIPSVLRTSACATKPARMVWRRLR